MPPALLKKSPRHDRRRSFWEGAAESRSQLCNAAPGGSTLPAHGGGALRAIHGTGLQFLHPALLRQSDPDQTPRSLPAHVLPGYPVLGIPHPVLFETLQSVSLEGHNTHLRFLQVLLPNDASDAQTDASSPVLPGQPAEMQACPGLLQAPVNSGPASSIPKVHPAMLLKHPAFYLALLFHAENVLPAESDPLIHHLNVSCHP